MTSSTEGLPDRLILSRQVYYLSGFDPRGARTYHQLYKDEAQHQAQVNAVTLTVGPRKRTGDHAVSWEVRSESGTTVTQTRYTFLAWDDIIRAHWPSSNRTVAAHYLKACARFANCGALHQLWQHSRQSVASVLLPALSGMTLMLLVFISTGTIAWLLAYLLAAGPVWQTALWLSAPLLGGFGWWAFKWAERAKVFWLARAITFNLRWGDVDDVALAARMRAFARQLLDDAAQHDVDEILIVGHSTGSMAAVSVLGELFKLPEGRALRHRVSLMTLGHVMPLASLVPEAKMFRQQVVAVLDSSIPWVDFTAPSDALCAILVDPALGAREPLRGSEGAAKRSEISVRSARFDRMFTPGIYKKHRKDVFRIHFQYLMSTDLPVHNDYFSITAGPKPLSHWMERST